jgi:hypothetical protein
MTEARGREHTADLLKGVGVVLMIQVHLVELFATEALQQTLGGRIAMFLGGPPAAPVFMAVMGYFLARTRHGFVQLLKRGVGLILGGLALNLAMNANLLFGIASGKFQLDPYAYVFGADILPLAGMSVIVIALLRPLLRSSIVGWTVVALVSSAIGALSSQVSQAAPPSFRYVLAFVLSDAWWSYFPLFPWLAYPVAGYAFCLLRGTPLAARIGARDPKWLVILYLVALAVSMPYVLPITSHLPSYYHHGVGFAAWTLCFLAGWALVGAVLERRFGGSRVLAAFELLGRRITLSYVVQWLVIGNIATELYRTQTAGQVAAWFPAVLATTFLVVSLWDRYERSRRPSSVQ